MPPYKTVLRPSMASRRWLKLGRFSRRRFRNCFPLHVRLSSGVRFLRLHLVCSVTRTTSCNNYGSSVKCSCSVFMAVSLSNCQCMTLITTSLIIISKMAYQDILFQTASHCPRSHQALAVLTENVQMGWHWFHSTQAALDVTVSCTTADLYLEASSYHCSRVGST